MRCPKSKTSTSKKPSPRSRIKAFVNSPPGTFAFRRKNRPLNLGFYEVRFLRFGPCIAEIFFSLGQLRIHLVPDNHHMWQQQAEIKLGQIRVYCSKDGHLENVRFMDQHA